MGRGERSGRGVRSPKQPDSLRVKVGFFSVLQHRFFRVGHLLSSPKFNILSSDNAEVRGPALVFIRKTDLPDL